MPQRFMSAGRPDGPLFGREAEHSRLGEAVGLLGSGQGTVLEIVGDPGVGKTSLMGVLAWLVVQSGARLARGHAIRGDAVPCQAFRDALGDQSVGGSALGEGERFGSVRGRLADWAGTDAGGALLLDDVQWCDRCSVDLALRLIRNPVPGPFLFAMAHRPRQTSPVLLEALDDGLRTGTVIRIAPGALDGDAARELAALWSAGRLADPPAEYVEQLRDVADGNPRDMRILLAAGWDPGAWPLRPGSDVGALLREAASLTAEFDVLSDEALAAARAAAVLGDPFRPEDIAPVCGLDQDHAFAALGELSRADLVRPWSDGGLFGFRNPVLGHVVHEHSDLFERLTGHRRALDLLGERGTAASVRARHAEYLLGTASGTAAPVLAEAAAEVVGHDPAAAARWLRLALDHLPRGERSDADRAELEILCCRALMAAGRLEEARTLIHEVLGRASELPYQIAIRAHGAGADIERLLCRYEEAEAIAAAALGLIPDLDGPMPLEAVSMIYEYGLVEALRGNHRFAQAIVRRAVENVGDAVHPTRVAIQCLSACNGAYLGHVVESGHEVERCVKIVDALPDPQAAQSPEMFVTLGTAEFYLERFGDATRHLKRGLRVSRDAAQQHVVLHQLLGLAVVDLWSGRLDQTGRWAAEAENLAAEIGSEDGVGLAKTVRATALIWSRGRRDAREAVALAESAVLDISSSQGWWTLSALGLLAQVQLLGGDPDAALRTISEGGGGDDVARRQPAFLASLRALMAAAALRTGDVAGARDFTGEAEAAAERLGLAGETAHAQRARAALHVVDGRHDLAVPFFAQAADGFQKAGMPLQRAWTLVGAAASVEAIQGLDAALGRLDAASAIADSLGALRVREEAARTRAELSSTKTSVASAHANPDGLLGMLSGREREIAELAATGLRSREIAQQLFLSPRTVDAHLGRIYRRLGVSSRGELARALANQAPGGSST